MVSYTHLHTTLRYIESGCVNFESCQFFCLNRYKNNHANQMGSNYYTNTFIGEPAESAEKQARDLVRPPRKYQDFYWTYHQFQKQEMTLETFEKSLATVRSFNLVLVTEWLNSASKEIDDVLGWKVPPKRVSHAFS